MLKSNAKLLGHRTREPAGIDPRTDLTPCAHRSTTYPDQHTCTCACTHYVPWLRARDFSQHPVLVSRSYLALRPIHSSLGPFAFLIFLGGTFILHERHTHPSERRAAKKRALRAKGDPASSMAVRRKIPNSSYSMARRMWEETPSSCAIAQDFGVS